MSEGGRLPSKRTVHEQMFGGGDEPLGATQHMADFHIMIIYYVRKVISGKSICFYYHWVPFHLNIRHGVKEKDCENLLLQHLV